MPQLPLMVGGLAPDFSLPSTERRPDGARAVKSSEYRGRWLMLVFYPRDFSLVCPTELTALSARMAEFRQRGCELVGVSTDSVETHEQWIAAPRSQGGLGGLDFPLASDLDGAVCRAYGVYLEWQKLALRGLFIIDPNGVLQYSVVHNTSVGRRTEELFRVLEALQSGGLCPENWTAGAAPLDPTAALVPGSVLAHYRFEEKLGSGSFASVFRARDLKLDRTVAIKVLQPGKGTSPAVAMREAQAAAALQHPNVCTIYSVDDSEGVVLIVMEHVPGGSLRNLLERGPLVPTKVRELALQVAQAMAAAHALGVVHGDLKPENILIADDGAAKIGDFGLARRDSKDLSSATVTWKEGASGLSGTPGYMAPELLEGQPSSPATDVFALGAILYEMATGRRAIDGAHVLAVLDRIRNIDGERLAAEAAVPFRPIIAAALQRAPSVRPSMSRIVEMLREPA